MNWQDHVTAAEGYLGLGMHADAFAELARIRIDDRERPEIYSLRLRIFIATRDLDSAKECSKHMTEIFPTNPSSWIARAEIVRRTEGEAASAAIFREACTHFPEHGEILYGVAYAAARDGDVTRARVYLASAFGYDESLRVRAQDDEDLRLVWDEIERFGD